MATRLSESDPPPSEPEGSSGGLDDTMPAAVPLVDADGAAIAGLTPVDRYRLGVELGRGGMGRVVEAFDVQLGRTVALKEALPRGGSSTYRRFAREIQITARLEHASIVPLYDSGTTPDGRPYYVMRRVSGRPLDELLSRARGLGERLTLLPALKAAIDAIGHAHRRGVIHRDLKPANILVGELGETVVIDWGLAKVIGEDDEKPASRDSIPSDRQLQTQVGSVFGTPGFMAPEQARGEELGPRGDVYALGATLYQLLSGAPPYGGKSATEVIDRNRRAQVKPIAEAAPAAPRELIAIVEKSLAADPALRYPDAAALAEDVRRFLDGQLVAAHRYTRGQRLRRFARKHRAALVVAALAAVAVAALTWFSANRVLRERALALEGKRVAEERAEALVVERARALLDANPTAAIAALKLLPRGSPLEPEARGIAQSATARGVAWGLDDDGSSDTILMPMMAPDGSQLAVTTRGGRVRIYDAVTHAQTLERHFGSDCRVLWVNEGKRLLVHSSEAPAFLLDPATGDTVSLPVGVIGEALADERGDRVVYSTATGVSLFELPTGKVTTLAAGHRYGATLAIGTDGAWIAVSDGATVIIFDGSGREVARKAIPMVLTPVGSRDRKIAVVGNTGAADGPTPFYQFDLDRAEWTELPPAGGPGVYIMTVAYRGDVVTVLTSDGEVREFGHKRWYTRLKLTEWGAGIQKIGNDLLAFAGGDGRVFWVSATSTGVLTLPSIMPHLRIAGTPHSSRLVAAGDNRVLLYDLATLSPAHVADQSSDSFMFLDDSSVLFWANADPWTFLRVQTGERVKVDFPWVGAGQLIDALPSEGRALFVFIEQRVHVLEVRDTPHPLHDVASAMAKGNMIDALYTAKLLPGGGIVYAADSVVRGAVGDAPPTELARMDGDVAGFARLGPLTFGAVSSRGELLRGSLATGELVRGRAPQNAVMVAGAYDGKLVIGSGNQLLLWDQGDTAVEIAHFNQPIIEILDVLGGSAVVLADGRVLDVPADPVTHAFGHPVELLPRGSSMVRVANGGGLLIAHGNSSTLNVAELPDRVRWSLPIADQPSGNLSIAPTTGTIVQEYQGIVTWKLPRITGDLHAWLDQETNATEDGDGDLAWPWQTAAPPPAP